MDFTPQFMPPSTEELQQRIDRLQAKMREHALNYYVSFCPDNIFYLTNFANFVHERPFILVLRPAGKPVFIIPRLEYSHVKVRSVGDIELRTYSEFPAPDGEQWSDQLRSLLSGASRVGIESICPIQIYDAIPGERVRNDLINDLRMIKSDYEIGRILYGCSLADRAHDRLLSMAKPGLTLSETASEIKQGMMKQILSDNPSTNLMATRLTAVFQPGKASDDPHYFTDLNMVMLHGGPHVTIINAVINGYGTEIERTFFIDQVPEHAKRPFHAMLEARHTAFELTVPGNSMNEVDKCVKQIFKKYGYEKCILHRTGHGMGVTAHEAPFLAEGYDRIIEPGMVMTIEPGIYLKDIGGFRHSDTILITKDGNLRLTNGPVELDALTLPLAA